MVHACRQYALDILEETGVLDCKPVDTPIDPNVKLVVHKGSLYEIQGDIDDSWENLTASPSSARTFPFL